MTDLSRTLCANQSHRRMIDPIVFAKRKRPFLIERVDMAPDPKTPKLSEERHRDVEQGSIAWHALLGRAF
jgi:hypothetical protein